MGTYNFICTKFIRSLSVRLLGISQESPHWKKWRFGRGKHHLPVYQWIKLYIYVWLNIAWEKIAADFSSRAILKLFMVLTDICDSVFHSWILSRGSKGTRVDFGWSVCCPHLVHLSLTKNGSVPCLLDTQLDPIFFLSFFLSPEAPDHSSNALTLALY